MPLKVLVVMEASTVSGPAKNLLQFADWARSEVDFRIATYLRGPENAFVEAIRAKGFEAAIIPEAGRFDTSVLRGLNRLTSEFKPDILQTHNVKSNFLVRLAGLYRQQPWLAFHHGYTATNRKDELYNLLNRWSLKRATHVGTVCEPFREHIIGIGVPPERVTIFHNTVRPFVPPEPPERAAVRERLGIHGAEPMLLSVGRLSFEKGHRDLLSAFSLVLKERPDTRLVFVGDGPERASLESQSSQLGVAERVRFEGQQSNVTPYYGAADVFVLPSHTEGSPNALLEAMAAGLPSVATRVGGVPEIAENAATAVLVQAQKPPEIARGVLTVLQEPALAAQIGAAARERVATHHTLQSYGERFLQLYHSLTMRK